MFTKMSIENKAWYVTFVAKICCDFVLSLCKFLTSCSSIFWNYENSKIERLSSLADFGENAGGMRSNCLIFVLFLCWESHKPIILVSKSDILL